MFAPPLIKARRLCIRIVCTVATAGAICSIAVPTRAEEACRLTKAELPAFLPRTQPPKNLKPMPATGAALPDDCDFYKWAWEAFLYATSPSNGKVALLSMPTFEDVFKAKESPLFADQRPNLLSLAPRSSKLGNKDESSHFAENDMLQAGSRQVLIDQNGNAVWYAIHLNKVYQAFVEDHGLRDRKALEHTPANLVFRTGSLELKSAWQIVTGPVPTNYITTRAVIPIFKKLPSGEITKDGDKTRVVTVALLGIHVAGTIDGHPEFVWSTFEHVDHRTKPWTRDVAPAATSNAEQNNRPLVEQKVPHYTLYPTREGRSPAAALPHANSGNGINGLDLDPIRQTFSPITPVYRQFPGSKSDDVKEDDAVVSLNEDVQRAFESIAPGDVRSNYQLVGAIWLNSPEQDFHVGVDFMEAAAHKHAQPLFGGEDRLSSTTMESFTQSTNSLPNCFACHNTQSVLGLKPSLLNVSHALSKYFALDKDGL